jgi:hypothetical protein
MENEELKTLLDALVGKTVAKWEFVGEPYWRDEPNPGEGVRLHFTDGTKFTVYESQQAGQVGYEFGEQG